MKTAANKALGVLDSRKRYSTEATALENHKTAKQKAYQKWLRTKSAEDKNTYKQQLAIFKRAQKSMRT